MYQIPGITLKILWSRRFAALTVAAFAAALLLFASGARASCSEPFKQSSPVLALISHPDDGESEGRATIVGLWHVIYTATSAPPPFPQPPFQFLESYKTWHGDGTEFENAFLPPGGGNICFGVWKDLSHGSVKLHHIGLMFASDGAISNIFTVDETDTVAHNGKTYKGTFDFKLFASTNVFGTGTPLAEVTGTTAGTRITVD